MNLLPTRFFVPSVLALALSSVGCVNSSNDAVTAKSSAGNASIHINQVGFLPASTKIAIAPEHAGQRFSVKDVTTQKIVYAGELSAPAEWKAAEEITRIADFSALTASGRYQLVIDGVGESFPFEISDNAYDAVHAASIKAYYFNRTVIDLLPEHAGKFARPAGHPDDQVVVHASAASATRPAGTVISSPKGWYDAGDYNKYIVNSGITTYTLLSALEHFPNQLSALNLHIPESDNALPDVLDEILWNVDWMLTMQDPADGGVYHKLTNLAFDGSVMPHEATNTRYVVQKGTSAALNFAAVMATVSRIVAPYEAQLPGYSANALASAKRAWAWAEANPDVTYVNPSDVSTGQYGDKTLTDEWAWAAAELFAATNDKTFLKKIDLETLPIGTPSWATVGGLAWMSLANNVSQLDQAQAQRVKSQLVTFADTLAARAASNGYRVTMEASDFVWGSNAVALNQAMMLIQAHRLAPNASYVSSAQSMLDYVLGRNAVGLSFVTGFGSASSMQIHHRPSEADGIAEPVPGFIAGGPQAGQQDKPHCPVAYPSNIPAKSYLDHQCSYASNEVAINWNAPLVYVTTAIKALTPTAQ